MRSAVRVRTVSMSLSFSLYQIKRGPRIRSRAEVRTQCVVLAALTRLPATHGAQLVAPCLLWYAVGQSPHHCAALKQLYLHAPAQELSGFPLLPGFIKTSWLLAQGHAIDTLVITKSQPTAMDCAQIAMELRTSAMATAARQPIVRKRYLSCFQQTGLRPAIVGRAAGPADGWLDADRVGSSIAPGTRAAEAPATHEPKHA